jgi:transcriptional regulator with XRE-family HTH domain
MGEAATPESAALGRQIAGLRQRAGLSQEQLANRAGVHKSVVSRFEAGEFRRPQPDKLARMAEALSADLEDFYALIGYAAPAGLPSFKPYLRAKYGHLTQSQQEQLARVFEEITKEQP